MNAPSNEHQTNGTFKAEEAKRIHFDRKASIDVCGDQLIHLLDEAEARVEQLRYVYPKDLVWNMDRYLSDSAAKLEIEKEQILDILGNLKLNSEMLRLGEGWSLLLSFLLTTHLL